MGLKTITCPYDECHQILPHRIQYHIVKCAKNHPEMDMAICPYNATHHIPRKQELQHLQECPDRDPIDLQKFRLNDLVPGPHGQLNKPVVYGSSLIPFEGELRHTSRPKRDASFGNSPCDIEEDDNHDDAFDLDPEDREVRDIIQENRMASRSVPPPSDLDDTQDSSGLRGMGRGTRPKRQSNPSQKAFFIPGGPDSNQNAALTAHQISNDTLGSSVMGRGMSCLKSYQQQRHRELLQKKVRRERSYENESFEDAVEDFSGSRNSPQTGLEMSLKNLMIHDQNMARLGSRR